MLSVQRFSKCSCKDQKHPWTRLQPPSCTVSISPLNAMHSVMRFTSSHRQDTFPRVPQCPGARMNSFATVALCAPLCLPSCHTCGCQSRLVHNPCSHANAPLAAPGLPRLPSLAVFALWRVRTAIRGIRDARYLTRLPCLDADCRETRRFAFIN